ncbi:uncharacterized protein LY89DRAFT_670437 [Mollisia scopiformis]|uniref:Uncharacterized protein n=1 Tax=Mollisia scopiformis TaxID=149040 RepID=A0A194X6U9_MOLSC|nr:uncharacterized protein LY89DRAFT_670437 [Mollisia scopiformis]KUJ15901.1 hypothetical protein LY89DRAFT_670437 [Mollisia scopiformis]
MGYFVDSEIVTTDWSFVKKDKASVESYCSSDTSDTTHDPNLQLPKHVADFFSGVDTRGYPQKETMAPKAQPWVQIWDGIVEPDSNGELLVACPKKCDFGE